MDLEYGVRQTQVAGVGIFRMWSYLSGELCPRDGDGFVYRAPEVNSQYLHMRVV